MIRNWEKNTDNTFSFSIDNRPVGTLEIDAANNLAIARINAHQYTFQRKGIWKDTVEIIDAAGNLIGKAAPEKWYANSSVLTYKNRQYKLVLRNNPQAEYAILENTKNILAYGIHSKGGNTSVKITSDGFSSDLMFDFLLWYLFAPIAADNVGDQLVFAMLLMNQ